MFALNEGSKWQASKYAQSLHGVVYLPMSNHIVRMRRRPLGDCAWQLFDPQLYLAGLDCDQAGKVCSRLATYPWFGIAGAIPDFDSDVDKQREWEHDVQDVIAQHWTRSAPTGNAVRAATRSAIDFQADVGCTHILLPTPLIAEREDEADTQAEWIDAGITASEQADVGQPIIATVAVAEAVLNDAAFNAGGFLDTIVDQVSSRDGLGGVYIVIAQTEANHPLGAPAAVTRAYAHLTKAFVGCGYEFVFVNFADAFGVACAGLGASGFATGPTQNLRRLSLAGFRDTGGAPYPRFYSHRVIGEFLPDAELKELASRQLLRRVTDLTSYSRDLFQSLNRSGRANNVVAWAESRNNVHKAAHPHFITRMISEGSAYSERTPAHRAARAEKWLDDAMVDQDFLTRRLADAGISPTFADASEWLDHYRQYA